jgi:crotonobetainyl-CoA:carnitine CoA-transferase CaiB-like acyl-CoA transferase
MGVAEANTGPLAGVRVIECASMVLGPLTGQLLGDMGADVIKVESPDGDLTRHIGPERAEGMSALFVGCNRNKRSILLDLKQQDHLRTLYGLVEQSDVFLCSIRPPAAERLGLGYEALRGHNENLVYCQVEGFGAHGPYAGKPTYDDIIQALSGLAMLQSAVAGEPRYVPSIIADKITGVHAAYAIALALFHRQRTGAGQRLSVAMFETVTAFNLTEHLWGHAFEPSLADMGYPPVVTAARRPFATLDGYLAVMPYTDANWRRFYEISGRIDLLDDERLGTLAARQQNVALVWDGLKEEIAKRSSAEWTALLEDEDIPFAAVNSLNDLLTDPHLAAVGFWQEMENSEGRWQLPRSPLNLESTPPQVRRLPPRLGEHTGEVLAELGLPVPAGGIPWAAPGDLTR